MYEGKEEKGESEKLTGNPLADAVIKNPKADTKRIIAEIIEAERRKAFKEGEATACMRFRELVNSGKPSVQVVYAFLEYVKGVLG